MKNIVTYAAFIFGLFPLALFLIGVFIFIVSGQWVLTRCSLQYLVGVVWTFCFIPLFLCCNGYDDLFK